MLRARIHRRPVSRLQPQAVLKPPRLFAENKRPDLRCRHQIGPALASVFSPHASAPSSTHLTSNVGIRILIASTRNFAAHTGGFHRVAAGTALPPGD